MSSEKQIAHNFLFILIIFFSIQKLNKNFLLFSTCSVFLAKRLRKLYDSGIKNNQIYTIVHIKAGNSISSSILLNIYIYIFNFLFVATILKNETIFVQMLTILYLFSFLINKLNFTSFIFYFDLDSI